MQTPSRPCRPTDHRELKADPERFRAETDPVGVQRGRAGDPDLELRNCRGCQSTLAVEVAP
jgi:hypothetical protein